MTLLRIAWRNLWRHRTRTLILASAVGFSYALLLISMGVGDDSHQQMLDSAVEGAGGDVLVHRAGYWEARSGDLVIHDGSSVLQRVSAVPEVAAVMPRIQVAALLSTSSGARTVDLAAYAPALERSLRDPEEDLVAGEGLEATGLSSPLLVGRALAEELEVGLGDRVVLTASRPDGELTRALFRVAGLLETGFREVDESIAFTSLPALREALEAPDVLTQIGIQVGVGTTPEEAREAVTEALAGAGEPLEVITWREAVPEMVGFIETDDAFLYIYAVVMFVVVAFAIANTFLVSVNERIREFGLLNALGLRGRRVGGLVLLETAALTAVSLAGGLVIALAAHSAIAYWGIPLSVWGLDEMELAGVDISDMVMRSRVSPVKWGVATLLILATTVGSALFAAAKAARLVPAEAMRFYE